MTRRSALATYTLVFVIAYAPIEIWYSLPDFWDPFFLVDVVGMALLVVGLLRIRREPSPRAIALLVAGYAWTGANFWRALFDRVFEIAEGGVLDYGLAELCFTACILIGAVVGLVWSIVIAARSPSVYTTR
jgi:hypothetical protein